ncbi:MAG TPA: hypothetical protein VEB86_01280 [Chryseosolibacter sp.]|nr:hypothetical protein [Chryseosolibacter sp.]
MRPLNKQLIPVSTSNSDEVDLLEVLLYVISAITRNKVLILVIFALGAGSYLLWNAVRANVYTGSFVSRVPFTNSTEMGETIAGIKRYIKEDNAEGLKNEFGFELRKLSAIRAIELIATDDKGDDFLCKIQATVTSPDDFRQLQKQLINTFGRAIRGKIEDQRQLAERKLKVLEEEATTIDIIVSRSMKQNGDSNFAGLTELLTRKTSLEKEKIEIKHDLERAYEISIVQNFPNYTTVVDNKPLKLLSLWLFSTFVVAIVSVAVCEITRMVKARTVVTGQSRVENNGSRRIEFPDREKLERPKKVENV